MLPLENRGTRSRKQSIRKSLNPPSWSEESNMSAPKLNMTYLIIVAFADNVSHKIYRVDNWFKVYDEEMTARTARFEKRAETIIKPSKFGNSDPMMILPFSGQVRRACNSNGVSKTVAMWLLPFFAAMLLTALLAVQVMPRKEPGGDVDRLHGLQEVLVGKGQECIYAYVEAVWYLLNS